MKKIKVSHEIPLFLLEQSRRFNDYDYALVHLLEENEKYRNFFLESKKQGREIYLDNSLHELGEAIGGEILMKWINTLHPTLVFIPDVWEDKNQSVINAKQWVGIEVPDDVEKVAIVQAKDIEEAFTCVQTYKDLGYKKIAFSYGNGYYNEICPHPNKNLGRSLGRLQMISKLYDAKILTPSDRIHLLGCSVPQEFGWYNEIECIESIDTSNPIMAALGKQFYTDAGLNFKPSLNMNNSFDIPSDIDQEIVNALNYNIAKFRSLNNL